MLNDYLEAETEFGFVI